MPQRCITGALFLAALLSFALPVRATDRVIWYPQQTMTSTGANQQARNERLAFGTWMLHALNLTGGVGTGVYANLTTSPSTGLYVTTAPTLASSLGALYQVQQDDTAMPVSCPAAITTCDQLSADTTLIAVPAFQSSVSSPLGPLTAPATSGQSIYYLIEAQVLPSVDQNNQAQNFLIANPPVGYTPQSFSVNITRTDQVTYQVKAGTASSSPTEPTVDSGWIAIAYVLVPYGTTQITSGMITASPPFSGFSIGGGTITAVNSGTNTTIGTSGTTVTVNVVGNPIFSGTVTASQFNGSGAGLQAGTIPDAALTTPPVTQVLASGPLSSTGGTTPSISLLSNPALTGTATAASFQATGSVFGGSGTIGSMTSGDLGASRSTSTGAMKIGGSALDCLMDFNISNPDDLTFPTGCGSLVIPGAGGVSLQTGGAIYADNSIFAGAQNGYPNLLLDGALYTATGSGTGTLAEGTSGSWGYFNWGAIGSTFTISPGTCGGCSRANLDVDGSILATNSGSFLYGPALSSGDIGASRGASSGASFLGGSSNSCETDYGVTTSQVETVGCPLAAPQLLQSATNDFAGTATNSSGTTATATLAASYTASLCFATDSSPANAVEAHCRVSGTTVTVTNSATTYYGTCVMSAATTCTLSAPYAFAGYGCSAFQTLSASGIAAYCTLSGTTITVTAGSSNSLAWGVILRGVPSATGHTFNYLVVGNPN